METDRRKLGRVVALALALPVSGCVPSVVWSQPRLRPAEAYDESQRVCATVPAHERGIDPFASLELLAARPIVAIEGKARVMRTSGVRLLARIDEPIHELERRVRCRALELASYQADPTACELLAIEGLRIEVRPRARSTLELRLTAPTRSAGVALVERARGHVERRSLCGMGACRGVEPLSSCEPLHPGSS